MAKLVAIGDSLVQGFQSLAVTQTEASYPAMIADRLGLQSHEFLVPDFSPCAGLPLNLEWLTRKLDADFGRNLHGLLRIAAIHRVLQLMGSVKYSWEQGEGSGPTDVPYHHNLAAFGFEVGDAYNITSNLCLDAMRRESSVHLPSAPRMRSGYRVLNPSQDPARNQATQISITREIAQKEGGIEHLIVGLGGNNMAGAIQYLKIDETSDEPPGPNSDFTLWTPEAFRREFEALAGKIAEAGAQHVYVATLPYLTIAPFLRGIMANRRPLPSSRKHFDHYTYFWIDEGEFDPARTPHLTRSDVVKIEGHVDEYNRIICDAAADHGWVVVDIWKMSNDLAVRRHHGHPKRKLPPPISDLSFLRMQTDRDGTLKQGGLMSLDAFHPTTTGYALIAQEFVDAMRPFEPDILDIDFAAIRKQDTLVSSPPLTINDLSDLLVDLERHFGLSQWSMRKW